MIPASKSDAVRKALRRTFGASEPEVIGVVQAGPSSDLLFRITVANEDFLLLIMPLINEIDDPRRRFTCMKIAAAGGLAPEIRYLGVDDGICVTRFIAPQPLSIQDARIEIPRILRRVHALTPFPKEFNFRTADKSLQRFRAAALLPHARVRDVFAQYSRLADAYPRRASDMVSSHCDLRRENVVFDGSRVWLLDWKAAFVNDRYFDLAVAANYVVTDYEQEQTFLREYFGRTAKEYEASRFFLMRQIVSTMAACLYLLIGNDGSPVRLDSRVPGFEETHRSLWNGEAHLTDRSARTTFGLVHWNQLEKDLSSSRFEQSLQTVARYTAEDTTTTLLPRSANRSTFAAEDLRSDGDRY